MASKFMTVVKTTVRVATDKAKAHSPEILLGVGGVGIVIATVLACKATLKLEETVEPEKEAIDEIKEIYEDVVDDKKHPDHKEYVKEVSRKYERLSYKVAKLYAPAVILGTLSLGTMFASNDILRRRNASLIAAYGTLDTMFKKYRANVVEEYGAETDRNMLYGIKKKDITVTEVGKNGKEKEVTKTVETFDASTIDGYSVYARFYDSTCSEWTKNPEYNRMTLNARQKEANIRLNAQGYLFLNDVYDMLGFEKTKAGQVVGWLKDDADGDGHIDFGMYEGYLEDPAKRRFVNGYEPVILLDFNVDGPIIDKIPWGTH